MASKSAIFSKTNALLTIFAHQHVPSIHTPEYTLKIPLLHTHCTSYHYTNNLSHKLIGILFSTISHYFSLFPISPKRCRIFASENEHTGTLFVKSNLKTLMSNPQKPTFTLWELSTTIPPGVKSSTSSRPSSPPSEHKAVCRTAGAHFQTGKWPIPHQERIPNS